MTDADLTADRVASIKTNWRWDRRDQPVSPSPEDVERHLPPGFRLGDKSSPWRILVRGKDTDGSTLQLVIARLRDAGIEAAEVEREVNAIYQFRTGKDGGSGSFLTPPGHPAQRYSIYGYHSAGNGKPRTNRPSGPDVIMGIEGLAEDEGGYYPKAVVERAKRILAEATTTPSEAWVSHVYGYFKHSYSPDGVNRNVSDAISTSKVHCACGEDFWNRKGLNRHIDTARAAAVGPKGRPARGNAGHYEVAKPLPPAEHHLGYLLVKSYFPDHTLRLDLIESGGSYGSRTCAKCGENVQYEARWDKYAKFGSGPDCPKGGDHEVRPHAGACGECGCPAS